MTDRRRRQAERREETRRELIDAAARVFAEHGFAGASIDRIAEEAGYSTGAIYWHFKGKDDLFLAVYEERVASRAREVTEAIGDRSRDAADRGREAGDQWMDRLQREPDAFRLFLEFAAYARRHPTLAAAFATRDGAVPDAVARQLEADVEAGAIKLPLAAEEMAVVVRALGVGLGIEKLTRPDAVRDELLGDFLYVLFRMLASYDGATVERRPGTGRTAPRGRTRERARRG
jgi:AcrR family transcriptional regulator